LNYQSSSLSVEVGRGLPGLRAGDRAPNAPCLGTAGPSCLYDVFRGSHFTLLVFGNACRRLVQEFRTAGLRAVVMGTSVAVVAVISVTTTIPVTGARMVAPKNAAIPTSAIGIANCLASPGHRALNPPASSTTRV